MIENNDITLESQLGICADDYNRISLSAQPFSIRVANRFKANGINTVADLLKKSPEQLMNIKGLGANSIKEIADFIEKCVNNKPPREEENSWENRRNSAIVLPIIETNRESIARGNFTFATFGSALTESESKAVSFFENAHAMIGPELALACYEENPYICVIKEVFGQFTREAKQRSILQSLLKSIPVRRRKLRAEGFVYAFTASAYDRKSILDIYGCGGATLDEIVDHTDRINAVSFELVKQFLQWCSFDLDEELEEAYGAIFKKPRTMEIVKLRSEKHTLEEVGAQFGVTRERVRQIESKAVITFSQWDSRLRVLEKISADRDHDMVLTATEISDYFEKTDTSILLHLLRLAEGINFYYDDQLDVFVMGDSSLSERVQTYVENLPEVIRTSDVESILTTAEKIYGVPSEMLEKAFYENYKLTGDVYHRSRLTLGAMYAQILEKYYPKGFMVYDPAALQEFREHVVEVFGDVNMPENDRALTGRISGIGILCGRGAYCAKKANYISKDLIKKIHDYIVDCEQPLLLVNSIFCVFENELLEEGVENQYYLQGILHELFRDEFTFRRDYISRDASVTSLYASVVSFIKKYNYPVSKTEIYAAFPGISDIVIQLSVSDPSILNFFGAYLHESKLKVSYEEERWMKSILDVVLNDKKAHHIKELYEVIIAEKPEVLSRNAAAYPFSTFSILEHFFREDYQFSRPYIALHNVEIGRPAERLHDLIYSSDEIAVSEISEFARDNHFQIQSLLGYVNTCNDKFLLYDKDTLRRITAMGLTEDTARIAEGVLLRYVEKTQPMCNLTCWNALPKINVPWTEWLLYGALKKWSHKLDVDVTSAQLRLACPVIAPAGKLDLSVCGTVDMQGQSSASIDNLDNIDSLLEDIIDDSLLWEDDN